MLGCGRRLGRRSGAGRRRGRPRCAHRLDDGRLQHRPERAGPRPGGRGRHDAGPSTSASSGPCTRAAPASSSSHAGAEAILAAVTPRTRLLALSHVLWTTGRALPVRELREQTGVPILVDGAQSVGAIPVDAALLDFYTVSGQKWLCGPDSTGGARRRATPTAARPRPSYFSQAAYEPRRLASSRQAGRGALRPRLDRAAPARRPRRRARAAPGMALRARRRAGGALP